MFPTGYSGPWSHSASRLDGFQGKLTSSKRAAIANWSHDTALRDTNCLITRGVLRKTEAGGRSTHYDLNDLPQCKSCVD